MPDKPAIIVVGAGPAGSTAATLLARAGVRVLLLEKRRFPRDKLCGGFLADRSLGILEEIHGAAIPADLYHDTRDVFAIHHRGEELVHRELGGRMAFVQRKELDEFLARRAQVAGAELREDCTLQSATQNSRQVELKLTGGERLRADWVVAADGIFSKLRKCFAPGEGGHQTALEMSIPSDYNGPPRLDFGLFPWGYAWDFPKRGLRMVGVCGRPEHTGDQKALLKAYRERLGYPESKVLGWPLPDKPIRRLARGRVLFTGDAAGLCEPNSGEGIYYALRSGERAARALLTHSEGSTASVADVGRVYEKSLSFVRRQLAFGRSFRLFFNRQGFQRRVLNSLVHLPDLKDLEWHDVARVALRVGLLGR